MRRGSQFKTKWFGCASTLLAFVVLIPSNSVRGQTEPLSDSSTPPRELAEADSDGRYGKLTSDLHPSIRSYGSENLNVNNLPDSPGKMFGASRSGLVVQTPQKPTRETNVNWRAAT